MGEMTVKQYVEKLNQHEPDAMKRAELFHKNTERNIKLDEDIERRIEKLDEVADV